VIPGAVAAVVGAVAVLGAVALAAVDAELEPVLLVELLPQPASSTAVAAAAAASPGERVTCAS